MEKNGMHVNGAAPVQQPATTEVTKELAHLRARLAEIASTMRRMHGQESVEARLTEDVSAAVQKLEASLLGCSSAHFE
jgi:hypothetical protein